MNIGNRATVNISLGDRQWVRRSWAGIPYMLQEDREYFGFWKIQGFDGFHVGSDPISWIHTHIVVYVIEEFPSPSSFSVVRRSRGSGISVITNVGEPLL